MPLFGGNKKDPGDAFEQAKAELAADHEALQQSWQQLSTLEQWRTFSDVRRRKVVWDPEQTEAFAEALIAYDKALRNLFQAFNRLKKELPI